MIRRLAILLILLGVMLILPTGRRPALRPSLPDLVLDSLRSGNSSSLKSNCVRACDFPYGRHFAEGTREEQAKLWADQANQEIDRSVQLVRDYSALIAFDWNLAELVDVRIQAENGTGIRFDSKKHLNHPGPLAMICSSQSHVLTIFVPILPLPHGARFAGRWVSTDLSAQDRQFLSNWDLKRKDEELGDLIRRTHLSKHFFALIGNEGRHITLSPRLTIRLPRFFSDKQCNSIECSMELDNLKLPGPITLTERTPGSLRFEGLHLDGWPVLLQLLRERGPKFSPGQTFRARFQDKINIRFSRLTSSLDTYRSASVEVRSYGSPLTPRPLAAITFLDGIATSFRLLPSNIDPVTIEFGMD